MSHRSVAASFDELERHLDEIDPDAVIGVSRGASPDLKGRTVGRGVVEVPAVAGRTVWDAATFDLAIVEQPNWWGKIETAPAGALVINHRHDRHWNDRTRAVRRMAGAANQIPGVRLAYPPVEAPWFVVLTPVASARLTAALIELGLSEESVTPCTVPELPGGVRLAPDPADPESWWSICVPSLAQIIERATEEQT